LDTKTACKKFSTKPKWGRKGGKKSIIGNEDDQRKQQENQRKKTR